MTALYSTITVQGPFQPADDPPRDAWQANAVFEIEDHIYRVQVIALGPYNPRQDHLGSYAAWQDAMALLTLRELSKLSPEDLPTEDWTELPIRLLDEPPSAWHGVGVEAYVRSHMPEYNLLQIGTWWSARPAKPQQPPKPPRP